MNIQVVDYDSQWPKQFLKLKANLWPRIEDLAMAFEHVGSTAVPGLSAKPILDIDVVIESAKTLPAISARLWKAGYVHCGNLGVDGREAFKSSTSSVSHNLYVCLADGEALRNHLTVREYLRANSAARDLYAQLKRDLAERYPDSIDKYVEGKTEFLVGILAAHGFSPSSLERIRQINGVAKSEAPLDLV